MTSPVRPHHDGRLDPVHNQRQGPLSFHPHARNLPTYSPDVTVGISDIVSVRRGLPHQAICHRDAMLFP
jgi:hypothetical protein